MQRFWRTTVAALVAIGVAGATARGETVKVGGLFDLTGVTSEAGKPYAQGVIDHVTGINEKGGVNGRKIELISLDYGYRLPQVMAVYRKLKDDVVLINGWKTGDAEALRDAVSKERIPYVSAAFAAPLTDPRKAPYNFTVGVSSSDMIRVFLQHAKETWKDGARRPRVAFIYADEPYGRAPIEAGRQYAKEIGLDLVGEQVVSPSLPDSTAPLPNVWRASPDFTFINTTTARVAIIVREAQKLGIKTRFGVSPHGCGELLVKVAKEAAEGALCLMPNVPYGAEVPGMKAILDLHKADPPKVSADSLYVRGWVHVTVWAEALKRAGGDLTGTGIRRALETFRNFDTDGLTPPITYTAEDHRATTRCGLYEIKGGKLVRVGEYEVPRRREWLGF